MTGLGFGCRWPRWSSHRGRPRGALVSRRRALAVVPALALSIGVGVAAAADLDLTAGSAIASTGPERSGDPRGGYELGIGRLAIDLRAIDWSPRQVSMSAPGSAPARLVVAVPSDVCVAADAHAGAGDLVVAGQQADGADVDLDARRRRGRQADAAADADVDLGQITVVNDDDADISNPNRQWDHGWDGGDYGNDAAMRAANTKACAR